MVHKNHKKTRLLHWFDNWKVGAYNSQRNPYIILNQAGIEFATSTLRQHYCQLTAVQHVWFWCSGIEYTCIHPSIHPSIHPHVHTCLFLILVLWHKQAIFESKGNKLPSCNKTRIRTEVPVNPTVQQTECSRSNSLSYRGSSTNFNSNAYPDDERTLNPLGTTADWLLYLLMAIYMFVIVNFNVLA